MKYARIINGAVAEILTPIDGFAIEQCFHANILSACVLIEDDVQVGWTQQEDGSWAAPVVPEVPEE